MKRIVSTLLLSAGVTAVVQDAEAKGLSPQQYIDKYKDIAVDEMNRTGIPASIKLAQGILESRSGNSWLTRKANNHFGIKCHRSWKGKGLRANDDRPNECFRQYDSAHESFKDHSNFLMKNKRYSFLFKGNKVDYKTWAKGLRKAGYATDAKYASSLIRLIEKYNLDQFDVYIGGTSNEQDEEVMPLIAMTGNFNGVKTVSYNMEMTPQRVAQMHQVPFDHLVIYNGLNPNKTIPAHTMIFLEAPVRRSTWGTKQREIKNHTVHQVANQYGIQAKSVQKSVQESYRVVNQQRNGQPMHRQPVPKPVPRYYVQATDVQHVLRPDQVGTYYPTVQQVPYVDRNMQAQLERKRKIEAQKKYYAELERQQQTNYYRNNYAPPKKQVYKVRSGDTLFGLARKYRTTVNSLKTMNNLRSDMIYIGQTLRIA